MDNDYKRPDGWENHPESDPWNTTIQQDIPYVQKPYPMQDPKPHNAHQPPTGSTQRSNVILILLIVMMVLALIAVGILLIVTLQKKQESDPPAPALESAVPVQQTPNVISATEQVRIELQPIPTENRIIETIIIQTPQTTAAPAITPTNAPTNAPTAAKPRISAKIEVSSIAGGDGYTFTLVVSGDYVCYDYDLYVGVGDDVESYGKKRSDQPRVRLTAGSSLSYVMAVVTPYNRDGVSGEAVTCLEYLPQYTPQQQNVNVESCWYQGEIITYGKKVASFTTDYVVNNGAAAHVRESLGNRWHIVAVNYCYSRGVHWYELYDADDGDYYGWVDLEYIDFW